MGLLFTTLSLSLLIYWIFVFKKKMNNFHMSVLTENYARAARVLHLQAISFRTVSIEMNLELQVTISESFQLKAGSEIASVFPCFNSAIPVEFGISCFWGLEENPCRRRDASQHLPYIAASLPLNTVTLAGDQSHRGGVTSSSWRKKTWGGVGKGKPRSFPSILSLLLYQ